ncbi:MAG TPA: hypothetical protein VIX58_03430 [Anaerolineae bacterium]
MTALFRTMVVTMVIYGLWVAGVYIYHVDWFARNPSAPGSPFGATLLTGFAGGLVYVLLPVFFISLLVLLVTTKERRA